MSTATAAPESEQLVPKGPEGVIFLSRRRELRLVMTARYPVFGQAGQKISETKGRAIQFLDGRYLTADEEEVEFLRRHHLLGDVSEGMWEVEPTAPGVTQEELERMMAAATSFDSALMREMLEQEQAGWNRPQLTAPLEKGIAAIEELAAQVAAQG